MSNEHSGERVEPSGNDDRSLRDHGRHLAMDSLLDMAMAGLASPATRPSRRVPAWAVPAAVAATVLLAVAAAGYLAIRPAGGPDKAAPPIVLAGGWRIAGTGAAAFRVLGPDAIRLERGELYVESTGEGPAADPLSIETPTGRVTGQAARFYVGCHADDAVRTDRVVRDGKNPGSGKERPMTTTMLTRVLVLAGMVTLANVHGAATGRADDLLVATRDAAPERHAVAANADFAVDLYAQLAKENPEKNLFFSPYSMASALAMTAEGARGETAAEMGKALRFPEAARRIGADAQLLPWNTSLIHTGMAKLNERFQSKADTPYEINVANALYGEKTFPFSPDYVATIGKFYGSGAVVPVDFRNAPEPSRLKINAWAEEKTRGRIKDVVPKGAVTSATRLALLNAIYFKGDWAVQFDATRTKQEDFHAAGGATIGVQMMQNPTLAGGRYGAFKADGTPFRTPQTISGNENPAMLYPGKGGFQIAELPYKGKELSMVVIVPQDADGLAAVEKQVTTTSLQAWLGALEARDIDMALPKFRIETDYEMKDPLEALGMRRAFMGGAEFDGLVAAGSAGLSISGVFHKAFVEVTEKGTEAAAATAVFTALLDAKPGYVPFTPAIRADRPFLFAIRDVKTGTLLFLGRMTDPTGTAVPVK
ncbi:MAG: serpin family protein [Planctomycetia bacterium]|jgi:serine protease inhibitor